MPAFKVLILPGDHIGPEVIDEAVKVLKEIQEHPVIKNRGISFDLDFDIFGGASIDEHGTPITEAVLQKAKNSDAVLFGAVGGPKWGAGKVRPESGVLELRKTLDCWANIRPCRFPSDSLIARSVIKEQFVKGTDFIVLRENCGGAYFGAKTETDEYASDAWGYSKPEVQRIARMAAYLARKHSNPPALITSCDKANVLAVSRLWRNVVQETHDAEFPDIPLKHQLADSATMIMMQRPTSLNGVLLSDNTFGDLLSDEAAVIPGSLGLLPSASLAGIPGESKTTGLYEPSHGSAPDLPKGVVNPIATILSAALMFRYSFELDDVAKAIDDAVRVTLDDKAIGGLEIRTRDLGGNASTVEIGDAIRGLIKTNLDLLK